MNQISVETSPSELGYENMQQMTLYPAMDQGNTFRSICDRIGCEYNAPAWPDRFGSAVSRWLSENHIRPIRTLSLFSGAGGLDIGFADTGFDIVSSVEIEPRFCQTLSLNAGEGKRFQHSQVNCIDIREFTGENLGEIDFIIGGPPCQTFSAAGRRANGVLGTTDARGVLFREYVRLLKELSPKGFLFENVPGIVGAQNGEAWKEILQAFSEVGYKLFYRIVDTADYGVPQYRERLLIVGLQDGVFKFPRPTHGPDSPGQAPFYCAGTALQGVVSQESEASNKLGGRYASLLDAIPPGLNYSFYTEEMGHPTPIFAWRSKFSDFLYKADPDTPVRTIKASGGAYTGPFHWENRFFNLEEYKRLQTFPDDYQISGSKQIAVKQIGNSVPPQLARIMAIAIRMQVFGTPFPFSLPVLEEGETLAFQKRKRGLTDVYREKARAAINALKQEEGPSPHSRTYYCSMDSTFRFNEVAIESAEYQIMVAWSQDLAISVSPAAGQSDRVPTMITIRPRGGKWPLGVDSVQLTVHVALNPGLTVAWKAFERELVLNGIKADLVQLNGYYQYPPKLLIDADIPRGEKYAAMLKSVLSNRDVPKMKSSQELAEDWGIALPNVMDGAEYLRALGYEIRNHATNSQIEEGMWLIPYAFPTLTPSSVQLWKKLKPARRTTMPSENTEKHLAVYEDRYELYQNGETTIYYVGAQSKAARQRYALIRKRLKEGFLDDEIASIPTKDFSGLSEENRALLKNMVAGITSEVGRALVGLACLQLAVKCITPEQSIRLHKGNTARGKFSWVEGISLRSLDKNFNTPFLRRHNLLHVNRDGVLMTRSLAENYPYSALYKADMRGPFRPWIAIVDAVENNTMPPELGLCFLLALLQNRSDQFREHAEQACSLMDKYGKSSFEDIKDRIVRFFNTTNYSARAFEIAMHGFYQAMSEMRLLGDVAVVPLSQMRSANKKHGNVGDIELAENGTIIISWDAKYGKPHLRDELEELGDKLLTHPDVKIAGFVCNTSIDRSQDICNRKRELELETKTEIHLFSFDEWIAFEADKLPPAQKNELGYRWLVALVESFAQKRPDIAPIDEPCNAWINDLISIMSQP